MSADNVLQKRYNNFLGLDLKSTDLVRPIEFASDILNAHYTKTGTIQKRVGYQSRAGSIGGSGLFVYAKIDPVTSPKPPGFILADEVSPEIPTEPGGPKNRGRDISTRLATEVP